MLLVFKKNQPSQTYFKLILIFSFTDLNIKYLYKRCETDCINLYDILAKNKEDIDFNAMIILCKIMSSLNNIPLFMIVIE